MISLCRHKISLNIILSLLFPIRSHFCDGVLYAAYAAGIDSRVQKNLAKLAKDMTNTVRMCSIIFDKIYIGLRVRAVIYNQGPVNVRLLIELGANEEVLYFFPSKIKIHLL